MLLLVVAPYNPLPCAFFFTCSLYRMLRVRWTQKNVNGENLYLHNIPKAFAVLLHQRGIGTILNFHSLVTDILNNFFFFIKYFFFFFCNCEKLGLKKLLTGGDTITEIKQTLTDECWKLTEKFRMRSKKIDQSSTKEIIFGAWVIENSATWCGVRERISAHGKALQECARDVQQMNIK